MSMRRRRTHLEDVPGRLAAIRKVDECDRLIENLNEQNKKLLDEGGELQCEWKKLRSFHRPQAQAGLFQRDGLIGMIGLGCFRQDLGDTKRKLAEAEKAAKMPESGAARVDFG